MPISSTRLLVRVRRYLVWLLLRSQRRRSVWLLALSIGYLVTLLVAYEKLGDHRFAKHVRRPQCNRTRDATTPATSCTDQQLVSPSTQLRYPAHGGALQVLCASGYSIDEFRELAERRLRDARDAKRGAAGYAGDLRGESPCCELSAAFSFLEARTKAHRAQSYFYEGYHVLQQPTRTLAQCANSPPQLLIALNTRASGERGRRQRQAVRPLSSV